MNAWGEDWAQAFCELQRVVVDRYDEGPHWDALLAWEAWAEAGQREPIEVERDLMRDVIGEALDALPEGSAGHDMARTWGLLMETRYAA